MANVAASSVVAQIRVLVVDDNQGFRESLAALLGTDGLLDVAEAVSGEAAIESARISAPDVVLMDVRMPMMDGIEATRLLKELSPSIGVVALTGNEDQRAVREMLVAGASGYVLKDSDGDEILNAVHQAAMGGGVISPEVTPSVIEELTEALDRERHRTHQLEATQEALLERAARRHELVSRLGHELRTPMTTILGIAQCLSSREVSASEHDEMLERLLIRANDLTRLIQRFEGAVEAGLTESTDVVDVVREVAADYPRVRVEAEGSPVMAGLNRQAARRILEELVENAVAFSPEDEPVTVSVIAGGRAPEVRVSDKGPGVDPAVAERIFGPLEQGEGLTTREHQGLGYGLSLARMSARAMGGDVTLESTGPEGSTFVWVISEEAHP